jgi:hypothetical protein
MYAINNARTGIFEFDTGIEHYMHYLANLNLLPEGRYCLAGGAIRSLFDKTTVKDLDIYILGTEDEHDEILGKFPEDFIMNLENPFSTFNVVNMTKRLVEEHFMPVGLPLSRTLGNANLNMISSGGSEVQIISLKYDSDFSSKKPASVSNTSRFANQTVSSLDEVLSSFDLTICKAGVEFTILKDTLAISEIRLPANFLTHVALRKMAFSTEPMLIPQQLCSVKRFHKYLKYGYTPDETFFMTWHERVKNNPHILSMSYSNDDDL